MFFVIIIACLLQYEVCVELCQKRQMEVFILDNIINKILM